MLMLKQDDEMFSVLLSPKTHRVAFFLFQHTHTHIHFYLKARKCVRPRTLIYICCVTFLLGMIG